ncbi:MAG: RNA polymerase sigma factor RpoD/SigA [Treponema sp.]|nr:RNA polymerase sigma factor RpoD/SigA [Treponema sp.]MBD5408880.1 RNA polymerase sigma factor RpoD/SigA [Treponema sp.]MBD5413272.1 RNA polymerase sigma factor RpoD/SigA [Treponema sp.]MBD5443539.1 RNA polymerase sigma factor RpoD/SigA [Treponema sp.]MDE6244383.1 RNA polymerase sigma factor RpoD/SigA [Treponemataceae bacterium]
MKDNDILGFYLKEINKIPLLTREEETELAIKAAQGDKAAKDKIIRGNLRFVVNIAKKYQNNGLDFSDLISEGNIGLITAIEHFDVSKGYHFISYAVWWIRQAILKAICEKSRAIRLPLNRANELVRIEHARKTITDSKTEDQEFEEVANLLHIEKSHVREMINISREMTSLDAPVHGSDKEETTFGSFVEDSFSATPDASVMKEALDKELDGTMNTLKPREKSILKMRYGIGFEKPMSLREVGEVCNLTKERIRQIEKRALVRMQHPTRKARLAAFVA